MTTEDCNDGLTPGEIVTIGLVDGFVTSLTITPGSDTPGLPLRLTSPLTLTGFITAVLHSVNFNTLGRLLVREGRLIALGGLTGQDEAERSGPDF